MGGRFYLRRSIEQNVGVASEELTFASDGAELQGTLSLPSGMTSACPAVVVAHGAQAGSKEFFLYKHLSRLLSMCGIATFRFDRRGEGASTGTADASFDQLARDLSKATAALSAHPHVDGSRMGLWGVSQGGWISVLSAVEQPSIAALVIVSGTPVTPAQQMTHAVREILSRRGYDKAVIEEALRLRATVEALAKREATVEAVKPLIDKARAEPWFADAWIPDLEELDWRDMDLDLAPLISQVRAPTLLLFGERDPWIPIRESISIWEKAAPPGLDLTIEIIPGVGHEMLAGDPLAMPTQGQPVPAYEQTLSGWMRRVLLPL
jgi:pimeloyl-ACP methyl ester carboxylesterase